MEFTPTDLSLYMVPPTPLSTRAMQLGAGLVAAGILLPLFSLYTSYKNDTALIKSAAPVFPMATAIKDIKYFAGAGAAVFVVGLLMMGVGR